MNGKELTLRIAGAFSSLTSPRSVYDQLSESLQFEGYVPDGLTFEYEVDVHVTKDLGGDITNEFVSITVQASMTGTQA